MIRRVLIITAAVVYAAVLACVVRPGGRAGAPSDAPPGPESTDAATSAEYHAAARNFPQGGLPYRSVGMQIQRVDWIDEYKKSIDEIAGLGADSCLLVVDMRQENGRSNQIYLDMRMTPTVPQLGELIDHAKKLKLRVILMPIVLLDHPSGSEWRGTIHPEVPQDWWDSYRAAMTHFAGVANDHNVDVLVVGSELVSMEHMAQEWTKTIADVRAIYKGQLTYSSNWDHYVSIPFWNQLDLIGMNSYWKMGPDRNVKTEQVVERWREIQKDLLAFTRKLGKPLFFTEIGWFSQANTAHEPWDYTKDFEPIDMDLQKRLYEAFFRAWQGNPSLGGFSVWEWTPGDGGKDYPGDVPVGTPEDTLKRWRGYTPEGKPAEKVLREWLAKPRWEVK